MHIFRTRRGRTFERSFCLGVSLCVVACSADMTPSKGSATTRDPQTASGTTGALDDVRDGGVVTRGAGMPILPIHREDAGAKDDAAIPVGNAPPVAASREDAGASVGVDAGSDAAANPVVPGVDAATPAADAGNALPPGAALPQPIKRFSFSGAGTNVPDLAGGGDALVNGNAVLDGAGAVSFPGQGDGVVVLPENLLDDATSFTVLVWLALTSDGCGQRAFDLSSGGASMLQTSLFLVPYGCPDRLPSAGYMTGGATFQLTAEAASRGAGLAQLGVSFSSRSQTLRLIVNGVVHKEQTIPIDTRTLQRAIGTLGGGNPASPQLIGTITELRVYASRLEPEELQAVYTRGPDTL